MPYHEYFSAEIYDLTKQFHPSIFCRRRAIKNKD